MLTSALRSAGLSTTSVAGGDAEQISWGKLNRLPCTIAESTLRVLDGYGLRGKLPARPSAGALYPVFVHRLARLFHASFRPRLAAVALASSLGLTSISSARGLSPPSC